MKTTLKRSKYNVIVIGAGGAGLMTARTLGDLKIKTLLIEKKNNILNLPFKTLGSFLDLDEFNLTDNVVATTVKKATIYSKHFHCTGTGKAYILDKVNLHREILNGIDKNYVDIIKGVSIEDFELNKNGFLDFILDENKKEYKADFFVDATGASGLLSKEFNLQDKKLKVAVGIEQNVEYLGNTNETHFFVGKEFQGGYGWIFPLRKKRAIFGFGSFEDLVHKDIKNRFKKMFYNKIISSLIRKDNNKIEGGTIPITDIKTKFIHKNLICVGDSISQVNPVLGEGYRYIFQSARMAASTIRQSIYNNDINQLNEYENSWKKEFLSKYKIAKKLQVLLDKISQNELLTDLGVLFLKTKRNSTIEKLFSGEFSGKELLFP